MSTHYLPRFEEPIRDTLGNLARAARVPLEALLKTASPYIGPSAPPLPPEPVNGKKLRAGQTISGRHFVGGTWTGLEHPIEDGPCGDFVLVDSIVEQCTKWASRGYRMGPRGIVERCAFVNVQPEHGIYWNVRTGDLEPVVTIRHSLFLDIESQAVQLVQRRAEQGFDFFAAGDFGLSSVVSLENVVARNVGYGRDEDPTGSISRAAFGISLFSMNVRKVRLFGVIVDKSMQRRSSGCLLVQDAPVAGVSFSGFLGAEMEQPLALFERVGHVNLSSTVFDAAGGQAWIDFQGCASATIRGCRGNARVHWNGRDVGSVEETLFLGEDELSLRFSAEVEEKSANA